MNALLELINVIKMLDAKIPMTVILVIVIRASLVMDEPAVMLMNVLLSGTNVIVTLMVLILLAVTTVSATRVIEEMAEPVTI